MGITESPSTSDDIALEKFDEYVEHIKFNDDDNNEVNGIRDAFDKYEEELGYVL